ncbi:MAG: histidine phosphatase family protein, partial [Magnetococcales bacterium]|nr:histidine phosphatase family protein [Magnetococcales bacterium]
RHGNTNPRQRDSRRPNFKDCSTQRNLTAAGRARMEAIGRHIRTLEIPISKVQASPYCRTAETGKLIFGWADLNKDLKSAPDRNGPRTQRLAQAMRALLATPPAKGANSVLVSHTTNLYRATRIWPKQEGVAVVFKPNGKGKGFRYLGDIVFEQWEGVVRAMKGSSP